LETDASILIQKARDSLRNYQHQLVIGNLLTTRKTEVVLVTEKEEVWVRTEGRDIDIEALIIPKCIALHQQRIKEGKLLESPENENAVGD
jgi:phosphopantothenate-cysteine ligase